jgi:hypothetical protein
MIEPQDQELAQNQPEYRHPAVGKHYSSQDNKTFEVLAVFHKTGTLWAHYKNTTTNEEYTATLEAFTQRFTPTVS